MYDPNSAKEGVHPGRKVLHGLGFTRWVSKGKGTPMCDVWFVVLTDLAAEEGSDGDAGELIKNRFAFTDAAMMMWGRFCLGVGYAQAHDVFDDDTIDTIIGKGPVIGNVKMKEWEGEERPEIAQFSKFGGDQDPEWEDAIAKGQARFHKLQAAMTEKARQKGGGGGSRRASAPDDPESHGGEGGGGGQGDDGIPF